MNGDAAAGEGFAAGVGAPPPGLGVSQDLCGNQNFTARSIDATPARWRGDTGYSVERTRRNEDAIDAVVCVLRLVSSTNNIKSECTSRHR